MSKETKKLINDIENEEISVTQALRRSLPISKQHQDRSFTEWLNKELNGYDDWRDIPEYRTVTGELVAFSQYHQADIPLDAPYIDNILKELKMPHSTMLIEELVEKNKRFIVMKHPGFSDKEFVDKNFHTEGYLDFRLKFNSNQAVQILGFITNKLLNKLNSLPLISDPIEEKKETFIKKNKDAIMITIVTGTVIGFLLLMPVVSDAANYVEEMTVKLWNRISNIIP
ncbi:hypothetical protein ACE1TI_21545 [Alteribacillus sp. JSM 102045]|uniref:AbiTii domain-containing protein n=1 Tax=Alteribacillus sp. JSM 102045 TaxID=1562101 RepID=UPI0035C20108